MFRRSALLAVISLSLVGVAACSNDDSTASDADADVTTSVEATGDSVDDSVDESNTTVAVQQAGSPTSAVQQAGATSTTQAGAAGTTSTTVAALAAPTVTLDSMRCLSGKLVVDVTARVGNTGGSGDKFGVASIKMARDNDEGAALSANATWYGPETGAGDKWTANVPTGNANFGKVLTVTAKAANGQSSTKDFDITVPC